MANSSVECDRRRTALIMSGEELDDDHIDYFAELFNAIAGPVFKMQPQIYLYFPDEIVPVAPHQKHIQLLYSCSELVRVDGKPPQNGHWVCSYYDAKQIHIYNSIGAKSLHPHHKIYLERLFPFFDFNKVNAVSFPTVDKQPNNNDCGLFSIAFAISILYGLKPENVRYYHSGMRAHLLKMFNLKEIEHFPRALIDTNVIEPLSDIQKKRKAAIRKTAWRMRNKKSRIDSSQVNGVIINNLSDNTQCREKSGIPNDKLHMTICDNKRKRNDKDLNKCEGNVVLPNSSKPSNSMTVRVSPDEKLKQKKQKAAETKARWRAKKKLRIKESVTTQNDGTTNSFSVNYDEIGDINLLIPEVIMNDNEMLEQNTINLSNGQDEETETNAITNSKHTIQVHPELVDQKIVSEEKKRSKEWTKLKFQHIVKSVADANNEVIIINDENITDMDMGIQESFHVRQTRLIADYALLNDDHIEEFGDLLKKSSNYEFEQRPPWQLYFPDRIEPVEPNNRRHIQILFSCAELIVPKNRCHEGGHWVCSYYDGEQVYIYDSYGFNILHRYHKLFLTKLYPYYDFNKVDAVVFPTVDKQPNNYDCGLFAMAFAVSIFYGLKPENVRYDCQAMRQHLLKMREFQQIEHFPCFSIHIDAVSSVVDDQLVPVEDQLKTIIPFGHRDFMSQFHVIPTDVTYADNQSHVSEVLNHSKINTVSKNILRRRQKNAERQARCRAKRANRVKNRTAKCHDAGDVNHFEGNKNGNIDGNYVGPSNFEADRCQITAAKKHVDATKFVQSSTILRAQISPNDSATKIYQRNYYKKNKAKISHKKIANYKVNRESILANKKTYYNVKKSEILRKRTIYYKNHCNKRKGQMSLTRRITRKYRKQRHSSYWIQTKFTKERYIRNVAGNLGVSFLEPIKCRLEAERIIRWCFSKRTTYIVQLKKILKDVKEKATVCLTSVTNCPVSNNEEYIQILCGQPAHNASSEAYFAETMYHSFVGSEPIVMNAEGSAINILPLIEAQNKTQKSWKCSHLCKTKDDRILNNFVRLLEQLTTRTITNLAVFLHRVHECSNNININKRGHSHGCYIDPKLCSSKFLSVEILAPHFPRLRRIKRLIYHLILLSSQLNNLDAALNNNDVQTLCEIADEIEKRAQALKINMSEIDLNETEIISKHMSAFRALTKRTMDTPRFPCISCEKLCTGSNVIRFKVSKVSKYGQIWKELHAFLSERIIIEEDNYMCRYCDGKLVKNDMPPTCILNNLYVPEIPKELMGLNMFEKILIQRAKAFQTVQRLGTVMNKNLPHKHLVPKAKGCLFILPLPLEETLKKICPPTDPINCNHELYILVRGIPTKSKIVWERMVDLKKIWRALKWLQFNNALYFGIELPNSHNDLLPKDVPDIEFQERPCTIDSSIKTGNMTCLTRNDEIKPNIDLNNEKKTALVTQMSQSDQYYEQFSIYPIHEKRIDVSATELYQMLKVHDIPLDKRLDYLDLQCFPDLYPHGVNGQCEKRAVRLTDFEFYKTRFMSKHSQFRLSIQYLFYALNNNNIRQMNAGVFHKLHVINPRDKYKAADYLDKMSKGQLESNLNTIFSRLRNTEQYWKIPRSNLKAMIREYGPATWFLTISPSEWLWDDLLEYLRDLHNIPTDFKFNPMELIVKDPVATSRFMDIKFKAMLDFICAPANPIGKVEHYFWRREYQSRGAQHFHLLLWIKNAPIIGKSSSDEIVSFIMKYVTCRMPDKVISPQLYRRVNAHQKHVHNSYCLKNKKTKTGFTRQCKFGHPRPLTETFKLRDVAVSIVGRKKLKTRSRLYDLPRSSAEAYINDYNPVILCAWEGNMDIQFIGENSTVLTSYVTKYISKSEKSTHHGPFEIINSTKSLASCLWNWTMRMLSNRECGALEAADSLLGFSLWGTDPRTTVKWLDVNVIRNRKLKARKDIEAMDPESTDLFYPSVIDTYYPSRPDELQALNLYDFARWYDIANTMPKTNPDVYQIGKSKFLKKRSRPCIINHYINNVKTEPERYYYTLLLLFKPWRDIDELKNGRKTYTEAFSSIQTELEEAMRYHDKITEIQQAIENVNEQVEKQLLFDSPERAEDIFDNNDVLECIPIEVEGAVKDFQDVGKNVQIEDITQMIKELNPDQSRIFQKVTNALSSNEEVIRLYVSGEGGTGKSFLIKTIRCWIKNRINKDTAVTAPTGIAAFNIDGLTIHRLFQLPVEHGRTPKYRQLSDGVLKLLRDELRNVVLIIIDEVSMISNVTLMYIHLRLTEIFNTSDNEDGWFGGKHILLFGDLLQLPPVHEDPAFVLLSTEKIEKYVGAMGSVDLWSALFSYDELRINMRQKDDNSFRNMLSRIRVGVITDSDTAVLESRKLQFNEKNVDDRLRELCDFMTNLPSDTVCLLPTCDQCDALNSSMLTRITSEDISLVARDTIDCPAYIRKKVTKALCSDEEGSSRTAGLAKVIKVKIGAKIMIRRNIDVSLGLVNGTIAKIVSVRRDVKTDDVETISILLPSGSEYRLERSCAKFEIMDKAFVIRKQFPICLSYGITIHKSQGLSLNNALIEVGTSIFICGQSYVALSRVTTLHGLHLINYDPSSVKANPMAIVEYNRLRKEYRPDLTAFTVVKQRIQKTSDRVWAISTRILECQGQKTQETGDDLIPFHVRGLRNTDHMSSYANSTLQCIIHCPLIREALLIGSKTTNVMKSIIEAYMTEDKSVDVMELRKTVGSILLDNVEQDVKVFIDFLCDKFNGLQNVIKHEISSVILCGTCGTKVTNVCSNNVFLLAIPSSCKVAINLQDIIDYNVLKWRSINSSCSFCGAISLLERIEIMSLKRVLVIQLLLFETTNGKTVKKKCSIKAVPTTTVRINQSNFSVIGAIFHHGNSVNEGYYTSMLRSKGKNAWVRVEDLKIKKSSWPRNGKDIYILFLQQI